MVLLRVIVAFTSLGFILHGFVTGTLIVPEKLVRLHVALDNASRTRVRSTQLLESFRQRLRVRTLGTRGVYGNKSLSIKQVRYSHVNSRARWRQTCLKYFLFEGHNLGQWIDVTWIVSLSQCNRFRRRKKGLLILAVRYQWYVPLKYKNVWWMRDTDFKTPQLWFSILKLKSSDYSVLTAIESHFSDKMSGEQKDDRGSAQDFWIDKLRSFYQ